MTKSTTQREHHRLFLPENASASARAAVSATLIASLPSAGAMQQLDMLRFALAHDLIEASAQASAALCMPADDDDDGARSTQRGGGAGALQRGGGGGAAATAGFLAPPGSAFPVTQPAHGGVIPAPPRSTTVQRGVVQQRWVLTAPSLFHNTVPPVATARTPPLHGGMWRRPDSTATATLQKSGGGGGGGSTPAAPLGCVAGALGAPSVATAPASPGVEPRDAAHAVVLLHDAARVGDAAACSRVLAAAAALGAPNLVDARHDGATALWHATLNNHADVVRVLLDAGASIYRGAYGLQDGDTELPRATVLQLVSRTLGRAVHPSVVALVHARRRVNDSARRQRKRKRVSRVPVVVAL